jgi:hypothetical protein|tara:strand:+ start:275 stop:571 length:297 start_codon:yes stop_codon:yes gene_type:complete
MLDGWPVHRFYCVSSLNTTMFELTLIPAYDHVYTSKKAVWDGWNAEHDFRIATANHRDYGRYINIQDAAGSGLACLLVRYGKRLEKCCSINLIKNRMN